MSSLLAVEGGALTPDMLLGMQVLYTIPDKAVVYEKLTQLWRTEGLDESLIPDKRTTVNTAEYALRSVETRKGTNARGDRLVVKVDRIATSAKQCTYQLTRQVLDLDGQLIEHEKGMTITFDADAHANGADPWIVRPFREEHYHPMRPLEAAVREHFNEHVGTVPGQKVRNAVRDYLTRKDKLAGTNMRRASGGVYFVPIAHAGTLDSLERVVKALYGDDADFDMIPMANSIGCREIVAKHHALNVADDAAGLTARIAERLRQASQAGATAPRSDFVANCERELAELITHKHEMDAMLGDQAHRAIAAFELIEMQLARLRQMARPVAA